MHAGIHKRKWPVGSGGGFGPLIFCPTLESSSFPAVSSSEAHSSFSGGSLVPLIPDSANLTSCAGATSSRYSRSPSVLGWLREERILTTRGSSSSDSKSVLSRGWVADELRVIETKCFATSLDGVLIIGVCSRSLPLHRMEGTIADDGL